MKTIAQVSTPTPIPAPALPGPVQSTLIGTLVVWSVTGAAVAGRTLWNWFQAKDQAETSLTHNLIRSDAELATTLINDLREDRRQMVMMIQSNLASIIAQMQLLNESVKESQKIILAETQSALRSQTTIYTTNTQAIGELKRLMEALHTRVDDISANQSCSIEPKP